MKIRLVLVILSASIHLIAGEPVVCKSIDEAIARGNLEAVQSFVAADPALSKVGANPRMTPLQQAILRNRAEIAAVLIEGGSDTKSLSACGGTPLHEAAASGGVEIITLLLKHGVDPATVSKTGDTALSIARQRSDATVISTIEKSLDTP